MRTLFVLAGLVISASANAANLGTFGWFADVVGSCWTGTFPDGKTEHTHCYTSQFDRFIRGAATLANVQDGKRTVLFSGDSVFAWNDAEKRIEYYIWGTDGSHSAHEARYHGEELVFPIHSRKEPTTVASRSVWRRLDAESFEVRREVPDGTGWKTELTVRYRKSGPAAMPR